MSKAVSWLLIIIIFSLLFVSCFYDHLISLLTGNDSATRNSALNGQGLTVLCSKLKKYSERVKFVLHDHKTTMILGFGGDVFMHMENITAAFNKSTNNYDFEPPFEKIKKLISEPDFTACALGANYEESPPFLGYPLFISPVQLLHTIKDLGFDIVFATNHVFDGGESGFLKRNQFLEKLKLKHPGEFATEKASQEILILEKNNIKIALLSYTYGTNGIRVTKPYMVNLIDKKKMQSDIKKAKELKADFVFVYLHQGDEYEQSPSLSQKETARFLAEQGVDVIVSSHPHVVQPAGLIKTTCVTDGSVRTTYVLTYSLGNLYCGQWQEHTQTGLFISMIIEKNGRTSQTYLKKAFITPTYTLIRGTNTNPFFKIFPIARTLKNYQAGKEAGLTEEEAQKMLAEWKNTVGLVTDPRIPVVIR